jgi:hypothetical protein
MSLKEKFQVVLNQRGQFKCPNGVGANLVPQPKAVSKAGAVEASSDENFKLVVTNLKQRGNARPRSLKTLTSTVGSLFPKNFPETELSALIQKLQSTGKVSIAENKVSYKL